MLYYDPVWETRGSPRMIEKKEFEEYYGDVMESVARAFIEDDEPYKPRFAKLCWSIYRKEIPRIDTDEQWDEYVTKSNKKDEPKKEEPVTNVEKIEPYFHIDKKFFNRRKDCLYNRTKLYLYLLINKAWEGKNGVCGKWWKEGYVISLIKKNDCIEKLGIKEKTYYQWINELKRDGYIDFIEDESFGQLIVVGRVSHKGIRYLYEEIM